MSDPHCIGLRDRHVKTKLRTNPAPLDSDRLPPEHREPAPVLASSSSGQARRATNAADRTAIEYYQALWGGHIYHGYFKSPTDSKERVQEQLIEFLWQQSTLAPKSAVLDVSCGWGNTARYLAARWNCRVTGITTGQRQVQVAKLLAAADNLVFPKSIVDTECFQLGDSGGEVRFMDLKPEQLGDHFGFGAELELFNAIWAGETLSRLPEKSIFFNNAELLLDGGKLVIADIFKADDLGGGQIDADVSTVEVGMRFPPLCTTSECLQFAKEANLQVVDKPIDITEKVFRSWDVAWSLIRNPNPAFPAKFLEQKSDFAALVQAIKAIQTCYQKGTLRYMVMVFERQNQ